MTIKPAELQDSVTNVLAEFASKQKRVGPTLLVARPHRGPDGLTDAVMLEMCIDLRSPDLARQDTQRLREIADLIEVGMKKTR